MTYPPGSAHESCPSATGSKADCTHFPDGAHRCAQLRGHASDGPYWHTCTCRVEWICLVGDHKDMTISGTYGVNPPVITVAAKVRL
jgi:hypothetical protein